MMAHACYDKKKRCPVCLREFYASRRDKICCSPRCKKRYQRAKPVSERLVEAFTEAQSDVRFISAYNEGDTQARAQRMLVTLIREAAGYLPDYQRWALAAEIRESVDLGKLDNSQTGQLSVLPTPGFR